MWPSSAAITNGRNVRTPRYTPPQHTLNVRSHTSRGSVIIEPPPPMPALLNSRFTWSVWCCMTTASRKASCEASSDTSQTWVVTTVPAGASASASRFVSSISSTDRSHSATWQPSAASCRTSSRPIPLAPPVTTATLPVKLSIRACSHTGVRAGCVRQIACAWLLHWGRGLRDRHPRRLRRAATAARRYPDVVGRDGHARRGPCAVTSAATSSAGAPRA